MKYDYHIHTEHSWDASGTMVEYCQRAIKLGIKEIGFSDHIDLDPIDRAYGFHDFEKIDRAINEIRDAFGNRLTIKKGIEITYQEEFHEEIVGFINRWNYDYTMAGIHLSKGVFYTGGLAEKQFAEFPDAMSAFRNYFDELEIAVKSGLIDIIAHIDVFKRHGIAVFGELDRREYEPEINKILGLMIENNQALEINSGDIANGRGDDIYPSDWIIENFRDMGGELITFGSDSHSPSALVGGYEIAMDKAKKIGFSGWTIFTNRKPEIVPFD